MRWGGVAAQRLLWAGGVFCGNVCVSWWRSMAEPVVRDLVGGGGGGVVLGANASYDLPP